MKRLRFASVILSLAAGAAACSDRSPVSPDTASRDVPGVVISNARVSLAGSTVGVTRASVVTSNESGVAYVSIAPLTYPGSDSAQIRNRTTNAARTVQMVHGGFDPVPIAAHEGDLLDLRIEGSGGTIAFTLKVPGRRPPTVVRSNPPKGRVDVAVNSVSVIFSEPIDPKTLTSASLQLLHDGQQVKGTIRLSEDGWTAEFVPDTPLQELATYELVVTQDIHDLDGDALDAPYHVSFENGVSPCPGFQDPLNCPPFPTGGSNSISGVVMERTPNGTRPMPNATVIAWVQQSLWGYARGRVQTDANGMFTITTLPTNGMIQLTAAGPVGWYYDQPCGVVVQLDGPSATANIELVSQFSPVLEAATSLPRLSGVVYEVTENGRQPVARARIWIDTNYDLTGATTTTDDSGRYAICRMPNLGWGQTMVVANADYQTSVQDVLVTGVTDMQLDIELKRR